MSYRFLREYSQIIAASVSSGYAILYMLYRSNEDTLFRESHHEFKNKKDTYEGLTPKEENTAKKFLYRLSGGERKLEFFRSNTFDFKSYSFNETRGGAKIGLPTSYLSKSREEFLRDEPFKGFNTLMGQRIDFKTIQQKSGNFEKFIENCLLSDDAKIFGLAKAVAETDHFIVSNLDIFFDFLIISICYAYCYSKNRQMKFQIGQRRKMYVGVTLAGLVLVVMVRFVHQRFVQSMVDKQASNMGLDCAEGAEEFYEKLINRNKILRTVMEDGTKYFDENGNYLKHIVNIPFTDEHFFINYMGRKLTERKETCQKELRNLLVKLNKEGVVFKESEYDLEERLNSPAERNIDNESEFFKNIRLKLEGVKGSKNDSDDQN